VKLILNVDQCYTTMPSRGSTVPLKPDLAEETHERPMETSAQIGIF